MEISSHYYALLALCRTTGINKETSHKIAYASQYVDDAKINCLTGDDGTLEGFEIHDIASCHSYSKIRTYNYESMIENTVSFHFPPGCEGNCFTKKLVCIENNPIIKQIIEEQIKDFPEVFGMLMHIYADTFAHQGFSGILSKANDIENHKQKNLLRFQDGIMSYISYVWKNLSILNKFKEEQDFDDLIPAYGHGQAEHSPDIPYLKWSYEYTHDRCETVDKKIQNIDNVERFKRAFESIQKYLEMYLEKNLNYKDSDFNSEVKEASLKDFFDILKARETTKNKIKSWQNFLIKYDYYDKKEDDYILTYDETLWVKELIQNYDEKFEVHKKRMVKNVDLVEGYEEKSWLKYVVGSMQYKDRLKVLCEEKNLILAK